MAFQVSPGVQVREIDLTNVVPAVSTSIGATVVQSVWGPAEEIVTVTSEKDLVDQFGTPTNDTAEYFLNAASFLKYGNNLKVVRAVTNSALNAVSGTQGGLSSIAVTAAGSGFTDVPAISFNPTSAGATGTATLKVLTVTVAAGGTGYAVNDTFTINIGSGNEATFRVTAVATGVVTTATIVDAGSYTDIIASSLTGVATSKLSGSGNDSLTVTVTLGINTITASGGTFASAPSVVITPTNSATATATITASGVLVKNRDIYEDSYADGQGSFGSWAAKYPGAIGNSLKVSLVTAGNAFTTWDHRALFDGAPGTSSYVATKSGAANANDELHLVVIDEDGVITGVKGEILERFAFMSQARDAKNFDGSTNYYKEVINNQSKYIWWMDHPAALTNAGALATTTSFAVSVTAIESSLSGGVDGGNLDEGDIDTGFQVFNDAETIDVNLLIGAPTLAGASGVTQCNNLIAIANNRKDVVAFISPPISATVGTQTPKEDVIAFMDQITSTSYAVADSGALKVYDKYNDVYRWIPAAGHIAGLCANTDEVADPWFSPSGYNRGQLLGVTKLAFNPKKAERDDLYKKRINPIVSFPGEGTILFGDKTLQAKPSAFDRINVRRLFIVLEKAIATAAKYQLFELNDEFTRAMFRNMTEPFLREIKGRRGITDFKVVCDQTNNTGEIIDSNQFVADIYIKPARSINFITLNFIATRTGVDFNEIGG